MKPHIEVEESYTVYSGGASVELFRMLTLLNGLRLEMKGMRLTRKAPTCYSIIKREFKLKGSRQKVLDLFEVIVKKYKQEIPVVTHEQVERGELDE